MTADKVETLEGIPPKQKKRYSRTALKKMLSDLQQLWIQFLKDPRTCEAFDKLASFYSNFPILFVICGIILLMIITPIVLFVTIVVVNIAITFIGFIVIEVSVLIVGGVVLSCIFSFFVTVTVITAFFFALAYFVVYYILSTVKNVKPKLA